MKQAEFRGCSNLVIAEVTKDDKTGYTTGEVIELAPVASVAKTTSTNSETRFYDNTGMIQITVVGSDGLTFIVPAMYLEKLAIITGATIDPVTKAYISSQNDQRKTYAVGYKLGLTDGSSRCVWKLRGEFTNTPDENSNTKSNDINTNNQTVNFTSVDTIYEFSGHGHVGEVKIDERDGVCDLTHFFDTVQTPDTVSGLVKASTTALSVSPTTASIAAGATTTITPTTTPASQPVVWLSSNPSVATVVNGVVTGNAAGVAVITAVSGSYSASTTVTVSAGA